MRGVLDRLIDRALVFLDEAPVITQVARQIVMHLRGAVLQRLFHVHHGGQFADLYLDRLGGIPRLFARFGHHGGDGIAHMPHLALRQNRMARFLHGLAMPVGHLPATGQPAHLGEIRTGEHPDHAGHARRGAGVHVVQRAMGHVRAQEMHKGLATNVDVVGVIAVPGQEPHVLAPLGTGADASVFGHVSNPP